MYRRAGGGAAERAGWAMVWCALGVILSTWVVGTSRRPRGKDQAGDPSIGHREAPATDVDALRRTRLFETLDEAALTALAISASRFTYARGQVILEAQPRAETVIAIVAGGACVSRSSTDGHEVTLYCLSAGDVFPLSALAWPEQTVSAVTAAADGTIVYHFPRACIWGLVRRRPEVGLRALADTGRRLAAMSDHVADLALYDVRRRLMHELIALAAQDGHHTVWRTHQELAARIGTTREEVARFMAQFRREHLIECPGRGQIRVTGLYQFADVD